MNNTINKSKYSFLRLFYTELKFSLTFGKVIGILLSALIMPFLIYYLSYVISGFKNSAFDTQRLLLSITGSMAIFMISRNIMAVQSKATVDKNKAAFLLYGKNKVTTAKLLIEGILFVIGFLAIYGLSMLFVGIYENQVKASEFTTTSLTMLPGYLTLYLLVHTLSKWVISFIPKRGLAIGASFLITILVISPLWIFNQISYTSTLRFELNAGTSALVENKNLGTHQDIVRFIPFLNNGLLGGIGHKMPKGHLNTSLDFVVEGWSNQLDRQWDIIFPIMTNLIMLGLIWNLQSSAQKRYLAAS